MPKNLHNAFSKIVPNVNSRIDEYKSRDVGH